MRREHSRNTVALSGIFKGENVAGKFSVSHIKSDNDQRKSSEHYIEDQKQKERKKEICLAKSNMGFNLTVRVG